MNYQTQITKGTPNEYMERQQQPLPLRVRQPASSPPPRHGEHVDLLEIWSTLRRNVWWILFIAFLTFAGTMALTLTSEMEFESSGRLYLGELAETSSNARTEEVDLSGGSQGDLASEMEILRSHSLVERSILRSGLNARIRREGAAPLRFFEWLRSGRDLSQLDVGAQEMIAINASLPSGALEPVPYEVRFVSDSRFSVSKDGVALTFGELGVEVQAHGARFTLAPGENHRPKEGQRYELELYPLPAVVDRALEELIVSAPDTKASTAPKVVKLSFSHGSPYAASRFLSRLMEGYLDERQAWKTEDATAAEKFVTKQLQGVEGSLHELEERLTDFRQKNQVVALEEEAGSLVRQLGTYEQQRIAARLEVDALEHLQGELNRPNVTPEAFMVGEAVDQDSVLENLASSLASSKVKLGELRTRFREGAPQVEDQQAQVQAHLSSIKGYVGNRLSRARQSLTGLNGVVGQYEAKLRTVPGAELQMSRLSRESEVYDGMYKYLLQRQQQVAILKASNVSKNRILDQPQVPTRENSPKLALRLASAPLGLSLGALIVLVGGFFSNVIHTETEARRTAAGLPIVARLPRRRRSSRGRKAPALLDANIKGLNMAFVEAVRTLRTNLYYMNAPGSGTVVMISSPGQGDGKTSCALGLASLLAADGKKVLVVDADLRKPSHHVLLKDATQTAFASGYEQGAWEGGAYAVSGGFGTFHSLRVDVQSHAEMLSGPEMSRFLVYLRSVYDYVLFDCAPYPLFSDALILARQADVAFSVLRLNKTNRQRAMEHLSGLARSGVQQGVIINDPDNPGEYSRTDYPKNGSGLFLPVRKDAHQAQFAAEPSRPANSRKLFA